MYYYCEHVAVMARMLANVACFKIAVASPALTMHNLTSDWQLPQLFADYGSIFTAGACFNDACLCHFGQAWTTPTLRWTPLRA